MVISLNTPSAGGASLVPYPSMLDVPHELVEHVSWLIYARRRELR
ncbi:IS5/IS1182 family transposase, partial [Streptomyces noursei]